DQRHFTEDAVLAQRFQETVAAPDLHHATHDDEELIAAVAFPEDRVSLGEIAGWNLRPHQETEVDLAFRHDGSPSRDAGRLCSRSRAMTIGRSRHCDKPCGPQSGPCDPAFVLLRELKSRI